MNCDIVKETSLSLLAEESLDLKIDKNTKTVIISGPRETVKIAINAIKNSLKVCIQNFELLKI